MLTVGGKSAPAGEPIFTICFEGGSSPIRLVPRCNYHEFTVLVATKQGTRPDLQLVYPDTASKSAGRISILSWLGMCLLGKRQGDRIGSSLWVEKVFYQPEDSNHFHL